MTAIRWWLAGAGANEVLSGIPASHRPLCLALTDPPGLLAALSGAASPDGMSAPLIHILLLATAGRQADPIETALREVLEKALCPFQVIHPQTDGWLPGVLQLMGILPAPDRPIYSPWGCENCADPACEHRLFQRLLEARRAP